MRITPRIPTRLIYRSVLVYAFVVAANIGIPEVGQSLLRNSSNIVKAETPTREVLAKRIPTNAVTTVYTEVMAASDWTLASIFGNPDAVAAANGFEPAGLANRYPLYRGDIISDDEKILRGHLSFAMHLYGSEDGTRDTEIYVPLGFSSHRSEPTPTDAAVTFYYPRLGDLKNVTLAVFHVADFHLSYEGGRVRIGSTGGPGGSIASYRHAHLEFYRGNTGLPSASARVKLRIDPVTVFASATVRFQRSEKTSANWVDKEKPRAPSAGSLSR